MEVLIAIKDAKLYLGTAGSSASTLADGAGNVKLNLEVNEASAKCRRTGFELVVPTITKASIDIEHNWDETDTCFEALWNAFITKGKIAVKCLSKTSGHGLDADMCVTKFERSEDLEDAEKASITLKPTPSSREPAFV